ncbi:MAG: SRPBCC domain-containing protein [Anaerolineae bacterium]|nr:SRPBCC domain-containing protein [Anaerolineae bacterium]
MKKILHAVEIRVPRNKVFKAFTTQTGLAGWWTTRVRVEEGAGGVIDFQFLEGFNPDMKVIQLDPDRTVHWQCVGGHDNWLDNTFSFELSDKGENTLLLFTQLYARELSDEVYGTYNFNWGYYLDSLKAYCETGSGKPFKA